MADRVRQAMHELGDAFVAPNHKQPIRWLLPVLGAGGALLAMGLVMARRTLLAFIASALAIAGVIGTAIVNAMWGENAEARGLSATEPDDGDAPT